MTDQLMTMRSRSNNDDNMIPLINIVFLLLIFFMVAGQIKAMPAADLQLPDSSLQQQPDASETRLEMAANGDIRLNGEAIQIDQLQTLLAQQEHTSVALFVDRRVTAEQLTGLLQPLRQLQPGKLQLHTDVAAAEPVIAPAEIRE